MSKRKPKKLAFHSSFDFNIDLSDEKENIIHNLIIFFDSFLSLNSPEFNTFSISVSWPNFDENVILDLKKSIQYRLIETFKETFHKEVDFITPDCSFLVDFRKNAIFMSLKPVFLYGNYCKFSRELAQTEHFCRFCKGKGCKKCSFLGVLTKCSVEQIIANELISEFGSKNMLFHGAGREDVDVLMLGNGRPFVIEFVQPLKRNFSIDDLKKFESTTNENNKNLISINSLKFSNLEELVSVKNNPHEKIYCALISLIEEKDEFDINKISFILDLNLNKSEKIIQKTPIRVEKRRALLDREKEITLMDYEFISKRDFYLTIKSSHGTYIKEFISGDEGRSNPSISSILNKSCYCKQLDVLSII
jgi:tRNA pseudouridine synthase 10